MSKIVQSIFGKQLTPDELVKKWRQTIRAEERKLDKQFRGIEVEELKVKKSLKDAAKKGDKSVCKMLAREILHSRKAKDRIHTNKAQLNSIIMQLQLQLAQVKVAGSLKKSAEIMHIVNGLIKLPVFSAVMREMGQEMMKAGIIEEMMEDTMDIGMDSEDIEMEADAEVEKVLFEITAGVLGEAGSVSHTLPEAEGSLAETETMKNRLEMLKN
jgi:charged multivesicular body protein 3